MISNARRSLVCKQLKNPMVSNPPISNPPMRMPIAILRKPEAVVVVVPETKKKTEKQIEYQFTVDWFSNNIPSLLKSFEKLGPTNHRKGLEIGAFEGRSTIWFLSHVLNKSDDHLFVIDTFKGSVEHLHDPNVLGRLPDLETRFLHNTKLFKEKITLLKGFSHAHLQKLLEQGHEKTFDFIYIDGSHVPEDVLKDAILSHQLLKEGGLLLFDDWVYDAWESKGPRHATDLFLKEYGTGYITLFQGWQLHLMKVKPKQEDQEKHF